jgi:ATP-dependent protease ClpP protease subunit
MKTLSILDEIKATSAKTFIGDLGNERDVRVRINSDGGIVAEALAIHAALAGRNATAEIIGVAASAASFITTAAKRVTMIENGFYMIHNAAGEGDRELLDAVSQTLCRAYAKKSGQSEDQIREWMREEKWFTAPQAKQHGFVDEIVGAMSFSASASLSRFKRAPSALGIGCVKFANIENEGCRQGAIEGLQARLDEEKEPATRQAIARQLRALKWGEDIFATSAP